MPRRGAPVKAQKRTYTCVDACGRPRVRCEPQAIVDKPPSRTPTEDGIQEEREEEVQRPQLYGLQFDEAQIIREFEAENKEGNFSCEFYHSFNFCILIYLVSY
jgi:hypothetical protein